MPFTITVMIWSTATVGRETGDFRCGWRHRRCWVALFGRSLVQPPGREVVNPIHKTHAFGLSNSACTLLWVLPSAPKDSEMSKSPHAAHLQMREDRRFAQLQRAWEKDQLLEMQRKLERWGAGSGWAAKYALKKKQHQQMLLFWTMVLDNGPSRYQRNAPEYERTEPVITSSGGLRQPRPRLGVWNSWAGVIVCWRNVKVQV